MPPKKLLSFLTLTALIFTSHAEVTAPPKGFRPLFNGNDLTGWYGLNPHTLAKLEGEKRDSALKKMQEEFAEHWRVENGELVTDGNGPCATAEQDFGDIDLRIEYKVVTGTESGIYLRGTPKVQIWGVKQVFDPAMPDRRPGLGSGGLSNNTPGWLGRDPETRRADKPFGEWNTFRIRQIGARTWVWLNDQPVVNGQDMENSWDKTKPLPAQGPIMLQTQGGEVRWRNIFVREIPAQEAQHFIESSPPVPKPTFFNVAYGQHRKQLIHFWKAESDKPTPVLFYIHGGAWMGGDRVSGLKSMLPAMLKAGISVASVGYRFIPEAAADGEVPPVKGPLHDAARALQFVRSKAAEWNIDKARIGACGGSAGACSSLWLAFHDDLADPKSDDPVARESTRLWCAGVVAAQTTLDPQQMKEWTPNSHYGGHAFGFTQGSAQNPAYFQEFLAKRDAILPWINEYSPYGLVTSDDPPIYLTYSTPPALGQEQKDPTHTTNFGVKLQEHCKAEGVDCELYYPGAKDAKFPNETAYLLEKLKSASAK